MDRMHAAPGFDEEEAWRVSRGLSDPGTRLRLETVHGLSPNELALREWILTAGDLLWFWKRHAFVRTQKEFKGYHELERALLVPHLEPFEVASWRLTDDVACDGDVVAFVAWCQGVKAATLRHIPALSGREFGAALGMGLQKLHRSPWTAFALAAPFMRPSGVIFPGHGYLESCVRLEWLLNHTHRATDAELVAIMASQTYTVAYEAARKIRGSRHAEYTNPPGPWYAARVQRAMGEHFRRSSINYGKRVVKKKRGKK